MGVESEADKDKEDLRENAEQEEDEDETSEGEKTKELEKEPQKEPDVLIDRKVIDEKLIRESVVDSLDELEGGLTLKPEEVELLEVEELSLSFKNIYAIDSIVGLDRLVKLQLDNNIIDKIQNLDHLVNLKWLDLSFNNITKIEGLDKLVNLTDLSLFNNQLTTIENLESLTNINVLSVGNNQIADLGSIKYLRRFENLRLLNMQGNPVCKEQDYKTMVFAHVTKLKYLDYVLVDAQEINVARDNMLDELVRLEAEETKAIKKKKEEDAAQAVLDDMTAANLGGLNDLMDWVCSEDAEYAKLKILPGYDKIMKGYRETIETTIVEFSAEILERHKEKEKEKTIFLEVVKKASDEAEYKSIEKIQAFEAMKKKVFAKFYETANEGFFDTSGLETMKKEISKLFDQLMDIEMVLVEALNDIMDEFEDVYMMFVGANVQAIVAGFNLLSASVTGYSDKVTRLVLNLLEQMANEDANPDEDNKEVTALLSDRDKVLTSCSVSADNHSGKIMQRGDEVSDGEDKTSKKFCADVRNDEYERNRFRVSEIQELVKKYNMELDQMFQDAKDDEENSRW